MPGPGDAHLFRAVLRGQLGDRMEVPLGKGRTKQFGLRFRRVGGINPALHPDLIDSVMLPVGEQADAVGTGHDLFEVVLQARCWKILVDRLRHIEGRRKIEHHLGDNAKTAQRDDRAIKLFAILVSGQYLQLSRSCDELPTTYRRRQIPVRVARAVGGGGTGASDGDVRKRRHVVQRITFTEEELRQVPVLRRRTRAYPVALSIQYEVLTEVLQRYQITCRVGDVVE